jgi:tRNA pseudouridine32 synthase/23S rRNA pseudouridine746 synthase
MDIPILYADPHFVVLNKPAGLPVHPGPRGGPSVEDCFAQLSRRKDGPWLAHRLDADTAGCLLVALRKAPLLAAQAAFAAGRVRKTYWAVVEGEPDAEGGVIDRPLSKITAREGWRINVDPRGQAAVTAWRVLGRAPGRAWLELHPKTGRTHQIRVHCADMGWPIFGDPLYGKAGPGLHLLARSLELQDLVRASAPPPVAMQAALSACGWNVSRE